MRAAVRRTPNLTSALIALRPRCQTSVSRADTWHKRAWAAVEQDLSKTGRNARIARQPSRRWDRRSFLTNQLDTERDCTSCALECASALCATARQCARSQHRAQPAPRAASTARNFATTAREPAQPHAASDCAELAACVAPVRRRGAEERDESVRPTCATHVERRSHAFHRRTTQ